VQGLGEGDPELVGGGDGQTRIDPALDLQTQGAPSPAGPDRDQTDKRTGGGQRVEPGVFGVAEQRGGLDPGADRDRPVRRAAISPIVD
jgi:hypothetical protein